MKYHTPDRVAATDGFDLEEMLYSEEEETVTSSSEESDCVVVHPKKAKSQQALRYRRAVEDLLEKRKFLHEVEYFEYEETIIED
jgi:hypothetical protein